MRDLLHHLRRAPGRILASIVAIALAVAAIGVMAVPTVSEGSLHAAVERQGLADIIVPTTPLDQADLAAVAAIDGVERVEGEIDVGVAIGDALTARLVGLDLANQQMDVLQLTEGRLPTGPGEIVTSPGLGSRGDTVVVDEVALTVVGHGTTLWWADTEAVFVDLAVARAWAPEGGTNRLVITAEDDALDELRSVSAEAREVLAGRGERFTEFPIYLPDGSTPIDRDIEQVSTLIGLLGLVAGLVALVLLASTTSTLVTERTREVAVMRSLGGRSRALRRRLRRIALVITAAALVLGLPLGVVVSNVIARMVLEEFVGITPDVAVDWWVLGLSAAGMLVGARVVSAHSARQVTKLPLAEALRDREGSPYGRRSFHRALARLRLGGLSSRLAVRASAHRPMRTLAVVAQVAAAVGATFLIASLTASVNAYNSDSREPWTWESLTVARDAGLPFAASVTDGDPAAEAGIWVEGETEGWQVDIYGLETDTRFFTPQLRAGAWIGHGSRDVVLSAGFAERTGISVGEALAVELASGVVTYDVVGVVDDHARTLYLDLAVLAEDLGAAGMANVVFSFEPEPGIDLDVATRTSTAAEVAAVDAAGRDAIVMIFGAVGAVVAGVAALAVTSSMTVSLYRRRHELAALQALGARRRRLRQVVARELLPIGVAGLVLGLVLGALGTRGIIASFESSNAVDIGVVDAVGTIPVIATATVLGLLALTRVVVRTAARRPIAVTLRGAA